MGRPTELLYSYRRIEKKYGKVTGLVGDRPGAVTDDTGLTLTLADAILERNRMITADELVDHWKLNPEFTWRKFLKSFKRDEGFRIGEHIAAWAAAIAEALSDGATVESATGAARENSPSVMRACIDRALYTTGRSGDVFAMRPAFYGCCLKPIPIDSRETIPAALAVFNIAGGDPMTAVIGGANLGRDSDTIAGMAGLLSGALRGIEAIDQEMYKKVCEVNGFDLEGYAERLKSVVA
jgi:ADP-ribosylglycohydrolase